MVYITKHFCLVLSKAPLNQNCVKQVTSEAKPEKMKKSTRPFTERLQENGIRTIQ